ncbi:MULTISPECIES: hypothetical protein [unclassified Microbacterium]|uniref:hypothetical protein n=1 Tax=unclassified Microbacterium TaxID=2609290 RepID=UPI001656BA1A|nr:MULTISPECIES: hypothetical protein [unclassified Microbacterium]MCT1365323.1 hypothetical protein [Microbacterium sp. p3-SID131]MCT1376548.1 hypothetical protein [Microbacterium sp. p3-SID337]CAD5140153.1 conserved membrane protein of unknown function [Microbacterium sp. Nx66]
MNRTVRSVATSLAVGFALYFVARGIWWIEQPTAPLLMVLAIAAYLVVVNIAILGSPATVRMPLWSALLALAVSAVIPALVTLSLEPDDRTAPFATWYIGALGLLGVVCVVRRRPWVGWTTLAVLVVSASLALGMGVAMNLGVVGSIMWVAVAQLLVMFWDRAVSDTERLSEIQQAVSAWHATQRVRQRERRLRTQFALAVAGPILSRVVASRGLLDDDERLEARLAEGRLRDELRGADLLNDDVRNAIDAARRHGASVTVFDEGGLDGVDEGRRMEIRDELAAVLRSAGTGRIIIRSARDPLVAVTVVGRAGLRASDDDSVDLWHEIARKRRETASDARK